MKNIDLKWLAEKRQTSIQEDNPISQIVHQDVNTLCKEPCQNSNDQIVDTDKPVKIKYGIISLTGDYKKKFLEAMEWQGLRKHFKAISEVDNTSNLTQKIKKGLKQIDDDRELNLLKVEDFNTKGLIGGEFDSDGDENNFQLLCKADFSTSSTPGRGGSYGVGKYVFWQFSNISTVLMSSTVHGRESQGLRVFGRCHVPSHKIGDKKYANNIYFPDSGMDDDIEKGKSFWGDAPFAKDLFLDRKKEDGPGTSILSVGFPDTVELFKKEEILEEIRKKLITWFWPCLIGDKPKNVFELERYENVTKVESLTISEPGPEWRPYVDAFQKENNSEKAKLAGDVAEGDIMVKIPKRRREPIHNNFQANVHLRVSRYGEDFLENPYPNHIALIRNSRMVIRYHKPGQKPLNENLPFFGVLKVGTLLGNKDEDKWSNEFFRLSEPPLHDDWTGETKRASNLIPNYGQNSGATLSLDKMKRDMNELIFELIDQKTELNEDGPKDLAKLFKFGSKGKRGENKKFNTTITSNEFSMGTWKFEGYIKRANIEQLREERLNLGFKCETDSGSGDFLEFKSHTFSEQSVSVESEGPPLILVIPDDVEYFDFKVILENNKEIEKSDLNFISIKLST